MSAWEWQIPYFFLEFCLYKNKYNRYYFLLQYFTIYEYWYICTKSILKILHTSFNLNLRCRQEFFKPIINHFLYILKAKLMRLNVDPIERASQVHTPSTVVSMIYIYRAMTLEQTRNQVWICKKLGEGQNNFLAYLSQESFQIVTSKDEGSNRLNNHTIVLK